MRYHNSAVSPPVNCEYRNFGFISLLDRRHDRIGISRIDQDSIYTLLDEIFNVGGFFGRIILGINHDQLDACLFCSFFGALF